MKLLLRRRTGSFLKLSTPFVVTKKDSMNYIFEYVNKELHNSSITSTIIDTLTIDGKLEIKYPLGKTSYSKNCQKDKNYVKIIC